MEFLQLPLYIFNHIGAVWALILLVIRFTGMMLIIPGIGMGARGLYIRGAAIMVFSFASLKGNYLELPLPEDISLLVVEGASEFMLGMLLGLVPSIIISGVQMAASLSSTTMGLGAANLIDPTLGTSIPSLARILGDLSIMVFLLIGGHYVVIYALSGVLGEVTPGRFLIDAQSVSVLVDLGANVFKAGVVMSAPVIVSLLLTQFLMGLVSKAVPTVNIFIISFPLTIGIGLVLTSLCLPELIIYLSRELKGIDSVIAKIIFK